MKSEAVTQDALAKKLAESVPCAGLFSQLQVTELSDEGLIDALIASERLMRFAHGLQTRVLGVLASQRSRHHGLVAGTVEAEVTAATRWAPSVVQERLETAGMLSTRFPETLESLEAGHIGWAQAAALEQTTAALDHDTARAVQARALTYADAKQRRDPQSAASRGTGR